MAATTFLLAEDHAIIAEGLAGLLKPYFELLGTVHQGRGLVASAVELRPEVAIRSQNKVWDWQVS